MSWFKIFIEKIKMSIGGKNDSNSGLLIDQSTYKTGNVSIKGDVNFLINSDIFPENVAKKILSNCQKNLQIIEKADISDDDIKNIDDFQHLHDVQKFLNEGIKSSIEIANFVSSKIKEITIEKNYKKRKDIFDALVFLKESDNKERKILVWSFMLCLFRNNCNNLDKLKVYNNEMNKLRCSVYKIPNDFYFVQNELTLFAKLGQIINDVRNTIFMTPKFWEENIKKGYLKEIATANYEDFLKTYPEFSIVDKRSEGLYNINYIASALPQSLKYAAISLLSEIGIRFKQ